MEIQSWEDLQYPIKRDLMYWVVHFFTVPWRSKGQEYPSLLKKDILNHRKNGYNVTWVLDSGISTNQLRKLQYSRRNFSRLSLKVQRTIEEQLANADSILGINQEDFFLITCWTNPLIIYNSSFFRKDLGEIVHNLSPKHSRISGEMYFPNNGDSTGTRGCVNNVAGVHSSLELNYSIGPTSPQFKSNI